MEEENKQEVNQEVKNKTKKFDFKKYLPIIGGIGAVVITAIVLILVFGGGPKKAVKKYVSAINGKNPKKMVKSIDLVGTAAWSSDYHNVKDFEDEDYEKFIEKYEEYQEEYEEEMEDKLENMIDRADDNFDDLEDDYKSYKVKINEFKKVEKLGKDLYLVKAKISVKAKPEDKDDDEIDESEIVEFIVYKNKIVSGGMSLF